jgi:hypothetical protein
VRLARAAAATVSVLLVWALVAGCSDSSSDTSTRPDAAGASPAPVKTGPDGLPLPTVPDCATHDHARLLVRPTSQGHFAGVLVIGHGTRGVVLAPQSDGDQCQWLPYARTLARRYRVALVEWGTVGREVPLIGVRALRSIGVRRVVLGGASLGGAYALADAWKVRPRLAGVMSFSGELTLAGGFRAAPGVRRWPGPLLALGSAQDDFFDRHDARVLARLHPGAETIVTVAGSAHGVDLLTDPARARVKAAVTRFLRRTLG